LSSLSFSFVSRTHFADRNPHRYILPPGQAQKVYTQSKVINNIAVGKNNTIINNGVGYERIAAVSREEIRKVVVRDPPTNGGKAVKLDRVERDGASLVVYRPPSQAQTPVRNALVPTRAQQEPRKDLGAAPQPNVPIANQGHAIPNNRLPFASSKPVSVTSISSRDEQTLIKTRTEPPAAANLGRIPQSPPTGKGITERGVQSQGGPPVTLPQPVSKPRPGSDPVSRVQSAPGGSPQTVAGQQIVKPINERGIRTPETQSALAVPNDSRPQPVTTAPARPQQQPYIVGQPNRPEIQRQAPAVRNYAQPQVVPQQTYRPQAIAPTYSPPQPVAIPPAQRYYSPPPAAQPAYRPAPVYTPPVRTEAARPAPVQAPRPQPQASPARQNNDKK